MIITSGHNNWISVSVRLEKDNETEFNISFNLKETIKNLKLDDAADYTAKLISEKYDNVHLMLSGGLDSEYVAKVFVRNNLKFTPIILINQTNLPEVWYAFKFCHEHNIEPLVLDYSQSYQEHTKFLKMLYDLSLKLKVMPNLGILHCFVASVVKNVPILTGGGEFTVMPVDNIFGKRNFENVCLDGNSFYIKMNTGDFHPGPFFTYTPEIFKAVTSQLDYTKNIQLAKSELYGLIPRSKIIYDLHSISSSPELKTMIEKRLEKLRDIDNTLEVNKDNIIAKLL